MTRIKLSNRMVSIPMDEDEKLHANGECEDECSYCEAEDEADRAICPELWTPPVKATTEMKLVGMTESEVEEFCGAAYDRGWYPDVDFEPLYGAGWALTGVQVTGLNYFAEAINILRAIRS